MSSHEKQDQENGRRSSRLRRLSDSTARILRQLRLVRSDSGYSSDDQRRDSLDGTAGSDEASQQSLPRLPSHDELEELSVDNAEEEAVEEEAAAAERREAQQLSNSERHLIGIKFALLREQSRTYQALWVADCLEAEELQEKQREEELSLRQKDVDLFKVGRRRRTSSSYVCEDSEYSYFDSGLERRLGKRREYEWRKHWQQRTSNWMYGDGYRNPLDYRY
ncbi:hypothetical protein BOX15_Mlig032919g1 [Macrostomum lignano]|uniref:Uncharacterized protein n=1 Tax=Macrostomum lignano TaxID=282301 RepID=A0A267GUQ2_9PLAT|nr:hypothetical protein BOX15_Mlig032919g1 [Macrostomum lignano]